jgi:hypothetical protein
MAVQLNAFEFQTGKPDRFKRLKNGRFSDSGRMMALRARMR